MVTLNPCNKVVYRMHNTNVYDIYTFIILSVLIRLTPIDRVIRHLYCTGWDRGKYSIVV